MAIDNVRLPVEIEQGALGGPRFSTRIHTAQSGKEQRIVEWDQARCYYNVKYGIRSKTDLHAVLRLFYARRGAGYPFRFKPWVDFEATSEAIGTGDGSTDAFQLIKTYTDGVMSLARPIKLPVSGTLQVRVAGVLKTETTHYTVNYATGVVTFTGGNVPTGGQAITATFEFDLGVRFVKDDLGIVLHFHDEDDDYSIGEIPDIDLIEVDE